MPIIHRHPGAMGTHILTLPGQTPQVMRGVQPGPSVQKYTTPVSTDPQPRLVRPALRGAPLVAARAKTSVVAKVAPKPTTQPSAKEKSREPREIKHPQSHAAFLKLGA